ncbi:MAG: hypothetical protein R3Y54_02840 [Eubacteriales bacterium]
MKLKKEYIPHLVLITLSLILFATAIYKLYSWNSNTLDELPGDDSRILADVESEDYIVPMNPTHLVNWEDDGITTIVMLGNELLTQPKDSTSIPSQLASQLDATIYNCAFPDTSVSSLSKGSMEDDLTEVFSLNWVINALCAQNFSILENTLANHDDVDPIYQEHLDLLQSIDFQLVDVLIMSYSPTDYLQGRVIADFDNPYSYESYATAFETAILMLKDYYPHIRIIFVEPTFCTFLNEEGELVGSDLTNTGYGRSTHYMVAVKHLSVKNSTSFLDNFYGMPIDATNYTQYLEDGIHPNSHTRTLLAERIANVLNASNNISSKDA